MLIILLVAVLLLVGVNVGVSVALLRSNLYTREQKIAQFLLVWLLPMLGALLVWAFLRQDGPVVKENPHPDTDDWKAIGTESRDVHASND